MITRLCDVGRCTATAIPLWVLVEMRLEMLVDSYRDDPQAHCAAQGDAVVMIVGQTPTAMTPGRRIKSARGAVGLQYQAAQGT